ncbi:MAG TPA: M13 family metallopeptidase [Kofleriaceae bacterium]|nr:M13 family metallopeptidase [Kofleriaceae bacterium]
MGGRSLALVLLAACAAKPAAPMKGAAGGTTTTTTTAGSAATPAPPPIPTAPGPAIPPSPASNATLAEVGLEAASLDRSVDPCVDFYQFACGGWLAANPIPADRGRVARFTEIDDKNKVAIKALLEEATTKGDPATKKLGDYYASCMDEAAIEKAGTTGIKALLDKTTKVKDAKSWLAAVTELHKVDISVVWSVTADADLDQSTMNITWLDAAGLGLPDRDYYLKSDFKPQLEAYQQHVGRMLGLAGFAKPEAAAADVVGIETELAKITKSATEKRDVKAADNPTNLKKLAATTKSVDWKAYFKALATTPSAKINLQAPKFFAGLDAVRKQFKPAQWSGYFTYHLLSDSSLALPKAFDDEAFTLTQLLSGATEKQPRFKRCIDATTRGLGELLGKAYVDKHFSAQSKQLAVTLFDALAAAMNDDIATLDWMSDATKKVAQDKLAKVVKMIGFPDKWRSYDFEVKRDDFAGNALRASAFELKRQLAKTGKPVDRSEWLMNTFTVDAYYNPAANNTVLPAGILQPPFFRADRSIAANLGGIGMVIGHELTHGFDDQGAKFDASGNLKNWWQAEDQTKFEDKGKCLAAQYDSFEALPKQYVNGQLTLGENIADLGGVKMAFKAYRALRKDAPKPIVADGFTEDQQFFLGVGQAWCAKMRPPDLQRLLTSNPHAPPKFRVYGALRNLPEFAQAFQCAAGTPMHPAQTCSVW